MEIFVFFKGFFIFVLVNFFCFREVCSFWLLIRINFGFILNFMFWGLSMFFGFIIYFCLDVGVKEGSIEEIVIK